MAEVTIAELLEADVLSNDDALLVQQSVGTRQLDLATLAAFLGAGGGGGLHGTLNGLKIIEISTGVWSGDAPARAVGEYPITFVGASDPAGANGIDTPGNINLGDDWVPS